MKALAISLACFGHIASAQELNPAMPAGAKCAGAALVRSKGYWDWPRDGPFSEAMVDTDESAAIVARSK